MWSYWDKRRTTKNWKLQTVHMSVHPFSFHLPSFSISRSLRMVFIFIYLTMAFDGHVHPLYRRWQVMTKCADLGPFQGAFLKLFRRVTMVYVCVAFSAPGVHQQVLTTIDMVAARKRTTEIPSAHNGRSRRVSMLLQKVNRRFVEVVSTLRRLHKWVQIVDVPRWVKNVWFIGLIK